VTDLERLGDEALNIAERTTDDGTAKQTARADLTDISDHAQEMLRGALEAFAHGDAERAERVVVRDDAVGAIYRNVVRAMIAFMAGHGLQAAEAVGVIQVSKSLERIADHAANIAEEVIFIVRGEDVRHQRAARTKAAG
jgi:phosphate transport system protein